MDLIDNYTRHPVKERIAVEATQQDSRRAICYARLAAGLVLKSNVIPDQTATCFSALLSNSLGDGKGTDSARLCAHNMRPSGKGIAVE
jgi:hypothetical protein